MVYEAIDDYTFGLLLGTDDPAGDFSGGPGKYKMVYEAIDDYTFGLLLETDDPAGDFAGGPGKYKMVYEATDGGSKLKTTHNVTLILNDVDHPTEISNYPRSRWVASMLSADQLL